MRREDRLLSFDWWASRLVFMFGARLFWPLIHVMEIMDDRVTDRATEAIAARFGNGQVAGKIRGYIVAAVR